jgi:hypothetical protein
LPDKDVVAKLWDSYTQQSSDRDNEVEAYMKLQTLWGVTIPRFVCCANFDFCWGIVVERVEVMTCRIMLIVGDVPLSRAHH